MLMTIRVKIIRIKYQRVYKPGSVLIAKGQSFIWDRYCYLPRATDPGDSVRTHHKPPLFGLAPDGVYRRQNGCPFRGALLPHPFTLTSKRRFAFCGTIPQLTLAGRYPASCSNGARTFLEIAFAIARPSDEALLQSL